MILPKRWLIFRWRIPVILIIPTIIKPAVPKRGFTFLSRVYLYKGDYANAKKYALDVINGNYGTFALNGTVDGAFSWQTFTTNETIWSIPNNINDNPNTNNALPQHYSSYRQEPTWLYPILS